MSRLRTHVPGVAAALVGGLLASTKLASLDLPLALANGDHVLRTGEIVRTNVWSWVHPTYPYLEDKWGFDVLCALANAAAGDAGLWALQIALGAAMGVLLYALSRRAAEPGAALGLATVGLAMLAYRLFLRAEWISYLFVGVTLLVLPDLLTRRRSREILFVALVPVAAACHAYWFVGPLVLLVAGAAAASLRTAAVGAAGFAAAAISPFGVANVLHPFRISAQVGGTGLTDAISELRLPFSGGPVTFFHVLAAAIALGSVAAIVVCARARRWSDAAVLAVVVAVSLRFDRNLAMLGLAVPLVARPLHRGVSRAALAVPALAILGVVLGLPSWLDDREIGPGWKADLFPFDVAAEAGPSRDGARYVNDLSIGSFLVRARGQAFLDGNTHGYPPEFLAEYRRALTGEIGIAAIDAKYGNDGWLLRHNSPTTRMLVLGLFLDGAYAPVKHDSVATLFRKESDADRADDAWRTWLRDVYLPLALPWFPSDREIVGEMEYDDDWARKAVVLCPWRVRYYDAMTERYAATGDTVRAARCLRYASRFPR